MSFGKESAEEINYDVSMKRIKLKINKFQEKPVKDLEASIYISNFPPQNKISRNQSEDSP